jgi:trehalose-6-phosphatase
MIVEVCSNHVNKRVAAERFLRHTPADLVLCAGDDQTDENMFRLQVEGLVTVKVGEGDTLAQYRLPDPKHLRELLGGCLDVLEKVRKRRPRSRKRRRRGSGLGR